MISYCSYSKENDAKIKLFMYKYESFLVIKNNYIAKVRELPENKELGKEKLFNEASLNINLGKFTGYNSRKDIYTFYEFGKLYMRTTPTRVLHDHVDGMGEIWHPLKKAFGDSKVMLHNKLEGIGKVSFIIKL